MKKILVILSLIPILLSAGLRPRNVIAELGTATWCGYCPQAYAGLEIMKDSYPIPDLVCVRYYASSGDYGSAEIDSRISYYGISGFPTCVFNGTESVVGGGASTADGSRYDPVVSGFLSTSTPFGVNVEMSIASNKATVTTTVKLYGGYSGTTPKLIVVLTEDDVTSEYTNLTRRVVTAGDVTITTEGQEQTIEQQFDLDASWSKPDLHAVAFIQLSTTKEVLQAGSTYPSPDYHYRFTAPSRVARIAPSGTMNSTFYLTNAGAKADNFNVTLDDSGLPSGWTATLVAPATAATVSLDPDESAEFQVQIKPNGHTGQGDVTVKVTSSSGGVNQNVVFRGITNDVDINIVDDDGGEDYEKYSTAALDAIGKTYGVWDVGMGTFDLSGVAADKTPVLVWSCGWSFPSLAKADRDLIKYYLDKGGKLFISGQDIGWDLNDGNSGNATYDAQLFYNNYLHAKYVADSAASVAVAGVAGDPISAGLSFNISDGDGADNQVYPDVVDPNDASATSFLEYGTSQSAGIRAQKDNYKVVYLGFGFEGIANSTSRKNLLEKALIWLGTAAPLGVEEESAVEASSSLKISTVSGGLLTISFNMPSPKGQLEIFDVQGRRVARATFTTQSGQTTIDMTKYPSGCYFARLSSAGCSCGTKFVVLH